MPVERILRPEVLVEHMADIIGDELTDFKFVSKYDENLIPDYPCVQIQPGETSREFHSTGTFLVYLRAFVYVMHDTFTQTKRVRSREELLLVTKVVDFLHNDITLGGRVIDGFVQNETPAVLPPRKKGGDMVVTTRIDWVCKNQKRFK